MSDKMKVWDALKTPPPEALKKIEGGRLKGMLDISPQWRYKAMTEQFGMCGVGWKYEVVRTWQEAGSEDQVFAFAEIKLFVSLSLPIEKINQDTAYVTWEPAWSDPIPGIGGSMLLAEEYSKKKEKYVLYSSDEAYKMAVTDALSVAMKMIGVGADVYMGMMDGKHTAPVGTDAPKKGTDDEKDHSKRTLLWKIMLKMNYDITDDARKELKILSGFTTKDKKFVEGKETVADLKGQRLAITLRSAEEEYEAWKKKEEPVDAPGPDDPEIPY